MKDRPILFSGPMVRAILEGRKTQTRRVVNPGPVLIPECCICAGEVPGESYWVRMESVKSMVRLTGELIEYLCPYGKSGDRLWVRESFWDSGSKDGVYYCADEPNKPDWGFKRRPSIHMPRWASRINLEITGIRVERLQDISRSDAHAEGFEPGLNGLESWGGKSYGNANLAFEACWKDINGSGSWDKNPWVWVVEFKRVP